ncbi:MAG TPA: GtrA family protein [Anaerolineaceae bacterium]|jgi:putative flippase GtrA|nr:GtrA family protein [Anaerolineaceae bacterium]
MSKTLNPEVVRFGKFLLVGALNTLIDFGLMNLFSGLLHMPLVLAQALSFILAVINSYALNRLWIYPETQAKSLADQFTKFAIINAAGLALRTLSISPVDAWFKQLITFYKLQPFGLTAHALSRNLALAVIIPLTLILNYLANRFWTFGDVARAGRKPEKAA